MIESIIVIGDGVSGTAAAWLVRNSAIRSHPSLPRDARQLLPRVTVVSETSGASALSSGALDDTPWEDVLSASKVGGFELLCRPLSPELLGFAEALRIWRLPPASAPLPLLAALSGRVRPARGHDRCLLDLGAVPNGGVIAVPRADRATWDADALAASWNDSPLVRKRGLTFVALDAELLRFAEEHRISDVDLASRHDDPKRLSWLAARLRDAFGRKHPGPLASSMPAAVILGPWLGVETPSEMAPLCAAEELSAMLQMPVGEALAGVGGAAGMRFVRSRDRLLESVGAIRVKERVVRVCARDDRTDRPSVTVLGKDEKLHADRLVLACGGLMAGGIEYEPPETHAGTDLADATAPAFRLSIRFEAAPEEQPYLAVFGERIFVSSSMVGPNLDQRAWPSLGTTGILESIGVAVNEKGLATPYLAAAGDVVADRPRTALVAAQSGLRAGDWAKR